MLVAWKEREAVKSRTRIQKIDPKVKKRRKCNEPSYSQRKMSKEKKSWIDENGGRGRRKEAAGKF